MAGPGQGAIGEAVEAEPWRQHQPLLRPGDGDVHAPLVVPVVDRRQGGDGVHHQQRRVTGAIDGPAHLGDAAGDAGGSLVVDDQHRPDAVGVVLGERPLDLRGIRAMAPVTGEDHRVESQAASQAGPESGEVACLGHEDLVARIEGVDQRGFPGPGARGGKDDDRGPGLEHGLAAFQHRAAQGGKLRSPVVDGGAIHRPEHPVRDVGGPGDLQEMTSAPHHVRSTSPRPGF